MSIFFATRTITPASADADGICQSQTPSAGGEQSLKIDGPFTVGGIASLDNRIVLFTFAADETGRTFTVSGQYRGEDQNETVAGTATTAETVNYYDTILSITIDNNSAGAITVGTNGKAASDWLSIHHAHNFPAVGIPVILSSGASLTWTAQYTGSDLYTSQIVPSTEIFNFDDANFVNQTVKRYGNIVVPVCGIRVVTTAYTSGSVSISVLRGN